MLVACKRTGQLYAMKVLQKRQVFAKNLVRYVMTERNVLSYVRHPFIVRLHYAFQTDTCLALVLHYCPGGNLSQLIAKHGALREPLAQLYMAEIFLAVEHLHERQVVYRDLKPENVVLDTDRHAMLTDFGLAKGSVEGLRGTGSFCGSVAYLAPEILERAGHGPAVDLYGLGVLLYEITAGRTPFYSDDRNVLFQNIVSATLQLPCTISRETADLISSLMARDPASRIGTRRTSDVRRHAFFAELDFAKVLRREVPVPPHGPEPDVRASIPGTRGAAGWVASPFDGALTGVMRSLGSRPSTEEIVGWEFGTSVERRASAPSVCRARR